MILHLWLILFRNGQSSLIQLNRLSKKYATEPVWSFPVDSGDQGCEVKLQFGDFVVEHKGKNKLEVFFYEKLLC